MVREDVLYVLGHILFCFVSVYCRENLLYEYCKPVDGEK
jgi:hypothetical protein